MSVKKKVYADYHGPRCTREHDGCVAQWKYWGTAQKSKAQNRSANHNADCIEKDGLNDLAALSYPLVGMQSQRDDDYIEYQILTAKLAHIDGFFVEWGFREHESNAEMLQMMTMAQKLDFEIGINWCDAWHFYPWIEAFHKDATTREKKTLLFEENVQYLLDHLFSTGVGAKVDGHPLIFLFGGGLTIPEFQQVKNQTYHLPDGVKSPYFLVRAPIVGAVQGEDVTYQLEKSGWTEVSDGIFGWIPTRVRNGIATEQYSSWDRYATTEDSVNYLNALRDAMQETNSKVHVGCVNPAMDNRACASWNKHDLSCILRDSGKNYQQMWQNHLEHPDDADIVYIVSWNDYTESHQIEPTVTDGYREVETTRTCAAQWKGLADAGDSADFLLPLALFHLRKRVKRLQKAGADTDVYEQAMDQIAQEISKRNLGAARLFLTGLEKLLETPERQLRKKEFFLTQAAGDLQVADDAITICSEESLDCMSGWAYDSYLSFSYLDDTDGSFRICHDGQELCDIKMDGTGTWKQAKIALFQENLPAIQEDPVLNIQGDVQIKDVSFFISAYKF